MLGNTVFRMFADDDRYRTAGTLRTDAKAGWFTPAQRELLTIGTDAADDGALADLFAQVRPDVVVNAIGIIKQQSASEDPLIALGINALLPHRLARLCEQHDARLVHLSTDCVFSGRTGEYRETDFADADDLYGRSKYLGEVDEPHALTLRTSIIGHELGSAFSLVDWFLGQDTAVKGYARAIFSGLPAIAIARFIRDHVLGAPKLHGVYHLAADPIDKHTLLSLVADVYGKDIAIERDEAVRDRPHARFQPPARGHRVHPAALARTDRRHARRIPPALFRSVGRPIGSAWAAPTLAYSHPGDSLR